MVGGEKEHLRGLAIVGGNLHLEMLGIEVVLQELAIGKSDEKAVGVGFFEHHFAVGIRIVGGIEFHPCVGGSNIEGIECRLGGGSITKDTTAKIECIALFVGATDGQLALCVGVFLPSTRVERQGGKIEAVVVYFHLAQLLASA